MEYLHLGVGLIVAGIALVFSGLIFLLPRRKIATANDDFQETQAQIEYYLQQIQGEHDQSAIGKPMIEPAKPHY
jgi:hypothetical protein